MTRPGGGNLGLARLVRAPGRVVKERVTSTVAAWRARV